MRTIWKERLTPASAISRGERPDSVVSPAAIVPVASFTWPVMALMSVVLPEPFGPMRPTTSPAATESETWSSARRPVNSTDTSFTARRVSDMAFPK